MQTKATNIIELRPTAKAFSIPLDKLAGYEGIKLLGRLIREWERKNKRHTYKDLARKANLYPVTVARIASGETKAPRIHTVIMIYVALGFSMVRFE